MTFNEASKPTLHLFRSLLRAATYLPDSAARSYFRTYIIHRFRETSTVTPERLRKGRQSLHILERAGHGEEDPLKKVIFMTYGRAGKRRRELITELQKVDEDQLSADSDTLMTLIKKIQDGKAAVTKKQNVKMMALILSHSMNHSEENPKALIRHLAPKIPATNIWGIPMPLNRRKSALKEWWAETLSRILPPLPAHEWNRLRDLATGQIVFEGCPPRRSRSLSTSDDIQGPSDLDYFTKPISKVHECDSVKRVQSWQRHTITAAYMRRLWSLVWRITPLMVKDEERGRWLVKWGQSRSNVEKGKISVAMKSDLELFENASSYSANRRPRKTSLEKKLNM